MHILKDNAGVFIRPTDGYCSFKYDFSVPVKYPRMIWCGTFVEMYAVVKVLYEVNPR